jgi:predicted nucleic acid-binding protein
MRDRVPLVDASVFLGMHHRDDAIRQRSLAFFCSHYERRVWMSYEQVGICDAVIWRQHRAIQDRYYPFMDRLHSDMAIVREGYRAEELGLAAEHPELRGLRTEQALLAAQVLARDGVLVSHDAALRGVPCLRARLWEFAPSPAAFPAELQGLYEESRVFVHAPGDGDGT